jgi:hypothetical protein
MTEVLQHAGSYGSAIAEPDVFRRFRRQPAKEPAGSDGQIARQFAGDRLAIPNQVHADHAVGSGVLHLDRREQPRVGFTFDLRGDERHRHQF